MASSSSVRKVHVKWGAQKFENVELDTSEPPLVFKAQLFALSSVPVDKQKVLIKGKPLADDADWASMRPPLKDGQTLMLVGTAEEGHDAAAAAASAAAATATRFVEDLADDDTQHLLAANRPPGLDNLGNTCYMNSTLQCLLSVRELRASLAAYTGNDRCVASLRELSRTLASTNTAVQPMMFLAAFRTLFPQFDEKGPGGGHAQQDAEEAWTQLVSTLERGAVPPLPCPASSPVARASNAVAQLFHGTMRETTRCAEEGDDVAPVVDTVSFGKMPCHISTETTQLLVGLRASLTSSATKRSERLGRDAAFTTTARISRLPFVLTVQFVRFFWKQNAKTKAKILKPVAFPMKLDMYDLCTDELQQKLSVKRTALKEAEDAKIAQRGGDQKKNKNADADAAADAAAAATAEPEKKKSRSDDDAAAAAAAKDDAGAMDVDAEKQKESAASSSSSSSSSSSDEAKKPVGSSSGADDEVYAGFQNDTGMYELQAVLTHKGRDSDSGHYVGWVKQADGKWYKFDDDIVSEVTEDEVKKLSGGGDWHIAYMLVYRTLEQRVDNVVV